MQEGEAPAKQGKKEGMVLKYPAVVREMEEGRGFLAEVPDLPGCIADGESAEEALANVRDAIEEWIAAARETRPRDPAAARSAEYGGNRGSGFPDRCT